MYSYSIKVSIAARKIFSSLKPNFTVQDQESDHLNLIWRNLLLFTTRAQRNIVLFHLAFFHRLVDCRLSRISLCPLSSTSLEWLLKSFDNLGTVPLLARIRMESLDELRGIWTYLLNIFRLDVVSDLLIVFAMKLDCTLELDNFIFCPWLLGLTTLERGPIELLSSFRVSLSIGS